MSNPNAYMPANINAYEIRDEAIEQALTQQAGHTSEGQQFSAIHVVKEDGLPTVYRPNSPFGDTGNIDQQYLAGQYDAAFPNHNYLTLDLPGHGRSDSLTKPQRKAVHNGDLTPFAAAQFEAATDLDPNLNEIVITAEAASHPISLAFALEALKRGVAVKHVFGFDPLSLERRKLPIALGGKYLANAQISRNNRDKEANDKGEQRLEDAFKAFDAKVAAEHGPTKHASQPEHIKTMAKQRELLSFLVRASLFTKDTGMHLLSDLLKTDDKAHVDLVFAGKSVIGRPTEQIMATLDNLSTASDNRLQTQVWPHDNQDLGIARHQPRLVRYAADRVADKV